MANEIAVLDPVEVADSRTQLILHPTAGIGPFMVREEGIDWGDAEIAAYMAELERGEVPVDYRIPNRKVTIPLMAQGIGAGLTNLVTRPSFEDGTSGWSLAGGVLNNFLNPAGATGPTQVPLTDPTGGGDWAGRVVGDGSVGNQGIGYILTDKTLKAGKTYRIRARVWTLQALANLQMGIGSAGTSGNWSTTNVPSTADTWQTVSFTWTPATDQVSPGLFVRNNAAGACQIDVDRVIVAETSEDLYFDGDENGHWLGAPHASASKQTTFAEARERLQQKIGLFQREGGWAKRQMKDGRKLFLDVVNATLKLGGGFHQAQHDIDHEVNVVLECIPDFYGEEFGNLTDGFSTDTLATDYTFDAGSGTLSVSGDQLVPSSTAAKRLYHSAKGQLYDAETTLKYLTSSYTSAPFAATVQKRLDATNYLHAGFQWDGANDEIYIAKVDGGATTVLATLNIAALGVQNYWTRFRVEGNKLTVEHWTAAPTPGTSPASTLTHTLTGADATKFGQGVKGHCGIYVGPGTVDWRYDDFEIAPNVYVEKTNPELIGVLHGIKGDYPGRARIVVDELDGDDQLGLLWGFRARRYSAASTAALAYEAEALDPLDAAAIATLAGASGGGTNNVVQHTDLSTDWTPVLGTNVGGTTFLTHTGTYRVLARLRSPDGSAAKVRFVWDVGDLVLPEENAPWQFPGASQLYIADLGEIRLDRAPVGSHRWQGQIQAKGDVGGEDIQIDKVWFLPLDEAAGRLRAPLTLIDGLTDYLARDQFTGTTAGNALSGRVAPLGGSWSGLGDAGDFTFSDGPDSGDETITRTTTGDTGAGRIAVMGTTNYTDCEVGVRARMTTVAQNQCGVAARITDANNLLRAYINPDNSLFIVEKVVAGASTSLAIRKPGVEVPVDTWRFVRLIVYASGHFLAHLLDAAGALLVALVGEDTDLATGGTLASGEPGIRDRNTGGASTRYYDNFYARSAVRNAVLMANQSAELRTAGMFREDASGGAYGPVSHVIGDLARIPPSGLEGRPVELFLKATRGDLDQLPDTGIDDIRAQVFYRPSWLFVPAAA